MIVYVFRHGHAEAKGSAPDWTDVGRRLVPEGKEQVEWASQNA